MQLPEEVPRHLKVVDTVEEGSPKTLPSRYEYAQVHVDNIRPNPYQPRKIFGEEELQMMAETIIRNGEVEEDVTLALYGEDDYVLINGERRWRATKKAGLEYIQAKIMRGIPEDMLLLKASIANFCVVDLNIIEKAKAIENMMKGYGWSQARVSQEIGVSQVTVSNILKVLFLDDDLQDLALKGELTPVMAFALARFEKESQADILRGFQEELGKRGRGKVSSSETNRIVQKVAEEKGAKKRKGKRKNRNSLPHSQLLSRAVSKAIPRLQDLMAELIELILEQPGIFQRMKDPTLAELLRRVEDLQDVAIDLEGAIERYVEK